MTATIAKDREERVSTPVFRDEGVVHPTRRVAVLDGLKDAQSIVGEEFRLLRARVQTICEQRAINCLAVVSALPGEGKSTVALGLATACAREAGRRILLVETDLRRPTISRDLGLPSFPGVGEYLNGETEHVPLRRVEPGGFFLLSSGEAELESPEILGSPRMEAFLRAARATFDLVILDATPVLPVADVVLILEKQRVRLRALDVAVRGTRRETEPRRYLAVHFVWTITGEGAEMIGSLAHSPIQSTWRWPCISTARPASGMATTYAIR